MTKLYSQLARVYHEMYQSIFDYKKEFRFFDKILENHKCKNVLEIGCGSGNLAFFFIKAGYKYTGLDLSRQMLDTAKKVEPRAVFVQGDMRRLKLNKKFDVVLITGRSFTYMETNQDVMNALQSVYKHLNSKGLLIFDNFLADSIFLNFKKKLINTAKYGNRHYKRISKNSWNLKTGWTWNWDATYNVKENSKTRTYKDKTVLRAFTKDEINVFLKLNKFKVLKTVVNDPGFTTIAKKLE